MDPNATMLVIRELLEQIEHMDSTHPDNHAELASLGLDLAEHVRALDDWLAKGGFLPSRWHFARR
jgi:hypothetical protein